MSYAMTVYIAVTPPYQIEISHLFLPHTLSRLSTLAVITPWSHTYDVKITDGEHPKKMSNISNKMVEETNILQ